MLDVLPRLHLMRRQCDLASSVTKGTVRTEAVGNDDGGCSGAVVQDDHDYLVVLFDSRGAASTAYGGLIVERERATWTLIRSHRQARRRY